MENLDNRDLNGQQEEEQMINLMDLLQIVRGNWHWFLLSIVVCGALAVLYLKTQPNVYSRSATVMIKDDK